MMIMNELLLSGIKDLLLVIAGGAIAIIGNIYYQKRTTIETYREKIFDKSLDVYEDVFLAISKIYKIRSLLETDINNPELKKEYKGLRTDFAYKIIFDVALFGDEPIMGILLKYLKATKSDNIQNKAIDNKIVEYIYEYIEAIRIKYGFEQLTSIETLTEMFKS